MSDGAEHGVEFVVVTLEHHRELQRRHLARRRERRRLLLEQLEALRRRIEEINDELGRL